MTNRSKTAEMVWRLVMHKIRHWPWTSMGSTSKKATGKAKTNFESRGDNTMTSIDLLNDNWQQDNEWRLQCETESAVLAI